MQPKEKRASFQRLKKLPGVTREKRLAEHGRAEGAVKALREWRGRNHLSQRQAVTVMGERDFPLKITTLHSWEQGRTVPEPFTVRFLEEFLAKNPVITDAPAFGKHTKFSREDVTKIRRLREEGATMAAIGERFKVDESYISRILNGERLSILS